MKILKQACILAYLLTLMIWYTLYRWAKKQKGLELQYANARIRDAAYMLWYASNSIIQDRNTSGIIANCITAKNELMDAIAKRSVIRDRKLTDYLRRKNHGQDGSD